jgi:hypothetical protein
MVPRTLQTGLVGFVRQARNLEQVVGPGDGKDEQRIAETPETARRGEPP